MYIYVCMYVYIYIYIYIYISLAKADRRSSQVKDQPRKTVKNDSHPRASTPLASSYKGKSAVRIREEASRPPKRIL